MKELGIGLGGEREVDGEDKSYTIHAENFLCNKYNNKAQ